MQATVRVTSAVNDTAKVDFAVVEGLRSGFGAIFRKAFDLTYYKQLWEESFIYKRVLPSLTSLTSKGDTSFSTQLWLSN